MNRSGCDLVWKMSFGLTVPEVFVAWASTASGKAAISSAAPSSSKMAAVERGVPEAFLVFAGTGAGARGAFVGKNSPERR